MSQIDTVKSVITSLRYLLSILISSLFVSIGMLVNDYRNGVSDGVTWLSLAYAVFALTTAVLVQTKIHKKSKELKDL